MNNPLSLGTKIYCPATIPHHLLNQYGNLRYQCFEKDDPNVHMDHQRLIELDHFDRSFNTLYVLVTQQSHNHEQIISAVRLMPTTSDYELEMESYRYLTKDVILPKSSSVFEGNRWVGKSSNTDIGKLSTGIMLSTLLQLSQELEFNQIIGTVTTKGEAWLNKRSSSTSRNSKVYNVKKENIEILISLIDLDDNLLAVANTLLDNCAEHYPVENFSHTERQAA